MTVVGLVDYMNTHVHCLLLYIDVYYKYAKFVFIQAIRTFFISNKQKYMKSTHAVEYVQLYKKINRQYVQISPQKPHKVPQK